jgi:hypothetical protein
LFPSNEDQLFLGNVGVRVLSREPAALNITISNSEAKSGTRLQKWLDGQGDCGLLSSRCRENNKTD